MHPYMLKTFDASLHALNHYVSVPGLQISDLVIAMDKYSVGYYFLLKNNAFDIKSDM